MGDPDYQFLGDLKGALADLRGSPTVDNACRVGDMAGRAWAGVYDILLLAGNFQSDNAGRFSGLLEECLQAIDLVPDAEQVRTVRRRVNTYLDRVRLYRTEGLVALRRRMDELLSFQADPPTTRSRRPA